MKFLQIVHLYDHYIKKYYTEYPEIVHLSFDKQIESLLEDGFNSSHIHTPYLKKLGYETFLVILNAKPAQLQWAKEHGIQINNQDNWHFEITRRQIEHFKPDVLYSLYPILGFDAPFFCSLEHTPRLTIGWRASSIPESTDWSRFDIILSNVQGCLDRATALGAKDGFYFLPGFAGKIADQVKDHPKTHDVVFSGGLFDWCHKQRKQYLLEVGKAPLGMGGEFSVHYFIDTPSREHLPAGIAMYADPPRFGLEMYKALASGRIVLNPIGDALSDEDHDHVNMRHFEITGVGSFMLTNHHDHITNFFEPGKEIETFKDSKELIEKIHYYIAHPDEREAIARRGQARCLRDYSMEKRAGELDEIIKKHLNMKKEASTRNGYSPNLNIHSLLDSLNKNDNEKALLYADQIIETAPQWPGVHYGKAVALVRMGREVEAKQVLQQLLARLPDHAKGRQLLQELERARITNPLTDTDHVALEKELEVSFLVDIYKPFGIDVRKYFHDYDTVQIYKCLDTGFRFYYPFDISGDGEFYEKLESFDWYYMDWKWEHEIAASLIHSGNKVLEVGCARGSFLKQIQQNGIQCIGLELNSSAAKNARSKGIEVLEQGIEDHAREYPGKYAVVCAFEVLEHIAKVKDFLQSAIDLLKPGGRLILSVPNNDAFMFKVDEVQALNRPPHHMGLWNMNAFINLCNFFRLKLEGIELEPLQPYHLKYNHSLVRKRLVQEYGEKGKAMIDRNKELVAAVSQTIIKHIPGHTLLAHYTKI